MHKEKVSWICDHLGIPNTVLLVESCSHIGYQSCLLLLQSLYVSVDLNLTPGFSRCSPVSSLIKLNFSQLRHKAHYTKENCEQARQKRSTDIFTSINCAYHAFKMGIDVYGPKAGKKNSGSDQCLHSYISLCNNFADMRSSIVSHQK